MVVYPLATNRPPLLVTFCSPPDLSLSTQGINALELGVLTHGDFVLNVCSYITAQGGSLGKHLSFLGLGHHQGSPELYVLCVLRWAFIWGAAMRAGASGSQGHRQ